MKNKIIKTMSDENSNLTLLRLTQKERPFDRFLASQSHQVEHNHQVLTLLSVTEIASRWHPAREIGASLPQIFIRSFNRSQHHSILTKFEDALKAVNANLSSEAAKVQTPINSVLALFADNEVYFSTIGNAKVLLLRDGKLSTVETNKEPTIEDETFVTVTSGELMGGDWFFAANNGLAAVLHRQAGESLDQPPAGLEDKIREIVELEDPSALVGMVARYTPEAGEERIIYLDEVESRMPLNLPSFKAPRLSADGFTSNWRKITEIVRSVSSALWSSLRRVPWRLSYQRIERFIPTWRFRKLIIPIGLIVILIIFGLAIRTKFTTAGSNQTPDRIDLVEQAAALSPIELRQFLNGGFSQADFDTLSAEEQSQLIGIANQNSIELTTSLDVSNELPATLVAIDNLPGQADLYLLDETGQLWRRQSGTIVKIEQKSLIGSPVGLTVFAENKIVVSDNVGNIWFFDGSVDQPIALTLPTKLAIGVKLIQKFESNLYLYSLADKSVYRVANYAKELTDATLYTQPTTLTLGTVSDWIITGDIIAVGETGTLQSFRRNVAGKINLPSADTGTTFRLSALPEGFVTINNRLFSYRDPTGAITRERIYVGNEKISDAVLADNLLWFVAGNKLYSAQ